MTGLASSAIVAEALSKKIRPWLHALKEEFLFVRW